jgi:general stress protein 26
MSVSLSCQLTTLEYAASTINLVFIANNSSPKFQEIQNDNHVNLSFFQTPSTHWASVSGIARVIEDRAVIKKYWSSWYVPSSALMTVACLKQTDAL